jgi:hypothetical protein
MGRLGRPAAAGPVSFLSFNYCLVIFSSSFNL